MYRKLLELLKLVKPRQPHLPQNNVSRCEKCGSKNVGKTWYYAYARGWNDLCNQAVGDTGAYCNNCGHITFVRSLEDFKKSLPNWCREYGY
jgi:hypothetical protein